MGSRKIDINPFNSILSILFLVAIFIGLYYVATGIFTLLSYLAPVFLIAALVIDHKVVVNYGKWLVNTLKTNFLLGLGAILLMVFGYPVIAGYLLIKAVLSKKLQNFQEGFKERTEQEPKYADFEEVDSKEETTYEDLSDDKTLDLNAPRPTRAKPTQAQRGKNDTDYNELFE